MWQSAWYPAPSRLTGILAGIWSVDAAATDLTARVLPDGSTCLVFQRVGSVLRSCDRGGMAWDDSSVSGPRTGPFDFQLAAAGRIFIVQLLPEGAMPVLGVPMSSLADRYEPLAAVMGSEAKRVQDLVQGAADDLSCVRAIEHWLFERVQVERLRSKVIDVVVREVARRAGALRVQDLAEHVNLSRRHLGRVMSERLGFSPKLFSRINRFDHAIKMARALPSVPWAFLAFDAGYSDQAHMVREFVDLGGIRPSDLRGDGAATIW